MRELITVMHVLLREGEFSAVDDQPEKIVRRSIMVAPQHGTRVRFRRVKTSTPWRANAAGGSEVASKNPLRIFRELGAKLFAVSDPSQLLPPRPFGLIT